MADDLKITPEQMTAAFNRMPYVARGARMQDVSARDRLLIELNKVLTARWKVVKVGAGWSLTDGGTVRLRAYGARLGESPPADAKAKLQKLADFLNDNGFTLED